jgi:hypothetical protein
MEIKTSYPVIIDGQKLSSSNYSNAAGTSEPETYTSGGLNIKTSYPVIMDDSDVSPLDYYANANGATPGMPEQAAMKQKGLFWDRTKGAWAKISNSPGAQFALEKVAEYMKMKQGGGFTTDSGTGGGTKDTLPDATLTDETPETMTMTTKIIIGVGVVAVLGLVGYGIFAKSKK